MAHSPASALALRAGAAQEALRALRAAQFTARPTDRHASARLDVGGRTRSVPPSRRPDSTPSEHTA